MLSRSQVPSYSQVKRVLEKGEDQKERAEVNPLPPGILALAVSSGDPSTTEV